MRIAEWIQATYPPPIVDIYAVAREYRRPRQPLINLGQGIPDMMPPPECLAALADRLADPALHRYGPDQGLPELRAALADDYRRRLGVRLDPEREILITAGANHGFVLALMATVQPRSGWCWARLLFQPPHGAATVGHDRRGVAAGCAGRSLRPRSGRDWRRGWRPARPASSASIRTTPPGRCSARRTSAAWWPRASGAASPVLRRGVQPDRVRREPAGHPYRFAGGREHTIVLGSFSKLFGMTGWRVGYLIAPPPVVEQMMKAQDTTVICAPVAGRRWRRNVSGAVPTTRPRIVTSCAAGCGAWRQSSAAFRRWRGGSRWAPCSRCCRISTRSHPGNWPRGWCAKPG